MLKYRSETLTTTHSDVNDGTRQYMMVACAEQHFPNPKTKQLWKYVGLLMATSCSAAYPIGTLIILSVPFVMWKTRMSLYSLLYAIFVLYLTFGNDTPFSNLKQSRLYRSIALYFDAEIWSAETPLQQAKHPKPVLILVFPHGVISFGGWSMGSLYYARETLTGAADIVLRLPYLRHLYGTFGMCSGSRETLTSILRDKKTDVCLYPGGLAELFLSRKDKEILYFDHRKGCIRLALTCGADIRIVYLFGNTQMFNLLGGATCAAISRVLRISMTLIWGRWGLLLPYQTKVIATISETIKMPDYSTNSNALSVEVINQEHERVKEMLIRTYEENRYRHPEYASKELHFI